MDSISSLSTTNVSNRPEWPHLHSLPYSPPPRFTGLRSNGNFSLVLTLGRPFRLWTIVSQTIVRLLKSNSDLSVSPGTFRNSVHSTSQNLKTYQLYYLTVPPYTLRSSRQSSNKHKEVTSLRVPNSILEVEKLNTNITEELFTPSVLRTPLLDKRQGTQRGFYHRGTNRVSRHVNFRTLMRLGKDPTFIGPPLRRWQGDRSPSKVRLHSLDLWYLVVVSFPEISRRSVWGSEMFAL